MPNDQSPNAIHSKAAELKGGQSALNLPSFPVVGIGASAGGVQALLHFFENMPQDAGMAFVIVLHLSPKHESRLDEILQRATKMPVIQVTRSTPVEKNTVYLISPSNNLSMLDGSLKVTRAERPYGRPVSIDLFFRSLAEAHGTRAISIVLSGTGSDGAVGISRIKECAGITIAQSPEDAEYDEMPRSALQTGMVDITLPVIDMPQKLIELWGNASTIELPPVDGEPVDGIASTDESASAVAEKALQAILKLLQGRTGHDFRHYKRATVLRRVERRLQVNTLANLPAYQQFLDGHPEETPALLKDMLIGVTNFFRDREAFEALEREVIPKIFYEDRPQDEQVRVWTAGCSTGEEAYSLAVLLGEQAIANEKLPDIQIFATDIDERAIERARVGRYPETILTDVPPVRLKQFFSLVRGDYVVNTSLREKVLFAPHNILRDPPFSQLDLVSCRNLLIYLERSVQRQVMETFHFSLKPGGYLFLGSSESADVADDLFVPVDKKNRIFQARALASRARVRSSVATTLPAMKSVFLPSAHAIPQPIRLGIVMPPTPEDESAVAKLHHWLRERHAPPSIVVDRDACILHMTREAGRFFHYVGGEPSHNVITLINPDLRLELRTALFQALQRKEETHARRVRYSREGRSFHVNVAVYPSRDEAEAQVALISFEDLEEITETDEAATRDAGNDALVVQLENELHHAKEDLQTSLDQASVSNEELMASNEELQAIIEELRSASEELEASKEELHSVNEELITVNGELQGKVEEAQKANDDLANLVVSSDIANVFVDRSMRIKRYTAPAVRLFNLIESDIGRPLLDLTHRLQYPELADDLNAAFASLKLTEREVSADDGKWFLTRLLPYRTADDRIDGVVLTLIDITARRHAQLEARTSEDRLKLAALATDDYAIIVQDLDGIIVSWNKGAERVFGYDAGEAIGQPIDLIFLPRERASGIALQERQEAAKTGRADDERWHLRKDGTEIYCSGVVTPINAESFKGFAKIARDVTDKKGVESQQQLQLTLERAVRAQAQEANRLKDEFFAVLSHELKNPLNLIHVKAELLTRAPEVREIALVQEAADAIQRSVVGQAKIIDDLLDLSRVRTGKLTLQFASADLAAIVQSVVEASVADAMIGGIDLSLSGAEAPIIVRADPVRYEQMVWNLVRNALKFTPRQGRVSLVFSRENGFVCLEVKDTGRGISKDFLPKLFDMFSQADGGGKRDGGGLGIGLSLVQQLAEMHGGRIEADSAGLGLGARFRLWLPETSALSSTRQKLHVDSSVLDGLRVLLVDDSLEGLAAFRALLELEGAQVHAQSSAEDALAIAAERDFDLILSDIGMPTMNGYELITALRKMSRTSTTPAIALTGFGRGQDAVRAQRAGYDAHLSKPVALPILLETITRVSFKGK